MTFEMKNKNMIELISEINELIELKNIVFLQKHISKNS